ncbi:hypothetical protein BD779DRAFT_1676240 [Infundibulicybe gibba]|nr:hypothetical protein BD779DRAFT_1676240 [Infundibulicybe gibba]
MPSTGDAPPNFNITSGSNLGALEIATFINLTLCGIVVAQGYSYYHYFTSDRPFLKIMVGTVLALEVSHSIATTHAIYNFTITLAAAAVKPANSYVLSTTLLLETLITAIVQTFFAYRIRSLSGNLYVSSLCWILCFVRFLGGIALTIENFLDIPHEPDYFVFKDTAGWLVALVLSVGAAGDLIIAASLCYYLNRLMPSTPVRRTAQIVDRLISWTIRKNGSGDKHGISCCSYLFPDNEAKLQVYSHDQRRILIRSIKGGILAAIYTVLAKRELSLQIYCLEFSLTFPTVYSNSLLLSMIVRLNVRMVNRAPPTTSKSGPLEFAIPVTQPGSDGSHDHHDFGGSRH